MLKNHGVEIDSMVCVNVNARLHELGRTMGMPHPVDKTMDWRREACRKARPTARSAHRHTAGEHRRSRCIVALTRKNLHHGWGKWWGYDWGGLCYGVTGWGTHSFDQIQRALGTDNPGPITKPETQYHIEDWMRCIKTRDRCNAGIEYGLRSTTLCYLVNIVREVGRVGETLRWDPRAERFTNCDQGNQSAYIGRPRRSGYELPDLA